jgi:putative flavoprotein involved in K+ transport
MLRVKRADLAARGVVRNESRFEGVADGRPVLGDGTVVEATNVIWATGFEQRFGWVDLPVFGEDGWPREQRGVVDDEPGLFFCGLAFQFGFSSMLLPGVGRDAEHVAERIARRMRATAPSPLESTGSQAAA